MESQTKQVTKDGGSIVRETITPSINSDGNNNISGAGCSPQMSDQDREIIVRACVQEVLRVLDRRAER